jgi:drug/metabolite transporter (DMT)-like permease
LKALFDTDKNRNKESTGIFYGMYVLAMLMFGTNGYLVAHISLQSSQIVLVRTIIGGLILTALLLVRKDISLSRIQSELHNLLFGGIALGLNWVALFTAYRLLNVSLATLIYYAGPMLVMLLSPRIFREKLTQIKIAAIAIVAAGLFCISGSIAAGRLSIAGLVTAIGSALLYAALIVFNKRIKNTSGMQTAALELDVAFVIVLLYVLLTTGISLPLASDIPYLLVIGLMNTGLAYLLYFTGLQRLPAQSVALLSYVDPVSALLFSALLLNESMTVLQIAGAVLIIGGAIIGELDGKHFYAESNL